MVWCLVLYTCCNGTENTKTQRLRGEVSPCNQFFSPNVVNLANIGKLVICGKMLDKSYLGFGDRQQYSGNNVIANSRICFKKKISGSVFSMCIPFGPLQPLESGIKWCFSSSSGTFSPRWVQCLSKCWELSGPQLLLPFIKGACGCQLICCSPDNIESLTVGFNKK